MKKTDLTLRSMDNNGNEMKITIEKNMAVIECEADKGTFIGAFESVSDEKIDELKGIVVEALQGSEWEAFMKAVKIIGDWKVSGSSVIESAGYEGEYLKNMIDDYWNENIPNMKFNNGEKTVTVTVE